MAFVSHVQVGEDRKLFASSHVGEPKPTGDDTQTAPTKVGIPPKLQAKVTVRPTLWLVLFLQQCVVVFRCSGEFSCVCVTLLFGSSFARVQKNVLHGSGAEL